MVNDGEPKIVVLSALSGTTNALISINDNYYAGKSTDALQKIVELERIYYKHADELFNIESYIEATIQFFNQTFDYLRSFANSHFSMTEAKQIIGQGLIQGLEFNIVPKTIINKALKKGIVLIAAGNNTIRFVPPLVIKKNMWMKCTQN